MSNLHLLSLNLDKNEFIYLAKVIENELYRWMDISESENLLMTQNYEYDSLHLQNALDTIQNTYNDKENSLFLFSEIQTSFMIESLDHEIDLGNKGESIFNTQEIDIIDRIRNQIKTVAVEKYGDRVLKAIHD